MKEITVQGISLRLEGNLILEDASLRVCSGRVTVLAGLNGAGKTTLLKALVGLLKPEGGDIRYGGTALPGLSLRERARCAAYLPQQPEAAFAYPAEEFILMGAAPYLRFWEQPGERERARVEEAMRLLGICHLKGKAVTRMSGGERQLCRLARAVVQDAGFLVLDEPAAALDYRRQREFMELLRALAHESGKGVLLSVHDPNLALSVADDLVLLHERRVIACLRREAGGEKEFYDALLRVFRVIYGPRLAFAETESGVCAFWKEEPTCLP